MNYDVLSIFIFLIIFIISLVAYSNEFIPNQFFGNETLILNKLVSSESNFTLKKWNCQHPLGKCFFQFLFFNYGNFPCRDMSLSGNMRKPITAGLHRTSTFSHRRSSPGRRLGRPLRGSRMYTYVPRTRTATMISEIEEV